MATLAAQVDALAAQIGADINNLLAQIAALQAADGNLASLNTAAKSSLVAAINEVKSGLDTIDLTALIDDAGTGTATTWSADKIAAQIDAAVAALVGGAPAALDTLNELATALAGNDADIAAILTAQANRVAVDQVQSFSATQQAQARGNIGAASAADVTALQTAVGDTAQDFVATYTAAKNA